MTEARPQFRSFDPAHLSAQPIVVGIDASRNRSGGAKTHLIGLLTANDPRDFGISHVHVWSYRALVDALPDRPWLVGHAPTQLEGSLMSQVAWQYRRLPTELSQAGCTVLLSTDAGSVCRFHPSVVMSRSMLPFDTVERQRFGWSKARLRLEVLRRLHAASMRRAEAVLFLTQYAAGAIQADMGRLPSVRVIPHGIGDDFRRTREAEATTHVAATRASRIRCLYVSNADMYKHQWHVVRGVSQLRAQGYDVQLTLVGGGDGPAKTLMDAAIAECDPQGEFVEVLGALPHAALPDALTRADVFIFASSCENMPNTLVEGMAAGLPIACSDRGPMPEILRDGGVYFDPEDAASISKAIARLIDDPALRAACSAKARTLSDQYSWRRCSAETWRYLSDVHNEWNGISQRGPNGTHLNPRLVEDLDLD